MSSNLGLEVRKINKEDFYSVFIKDKFIDGPFLESFGDGYGDVYNPHRQAFGKLDNLRIVYCELSKANRIKAKNLLDKIKNL